MQAFPISGVQYLLSTIVVSSSQNSCDIGLFIVFRSSSKKRVSGYTQTDISLFSLTLHRKMSKQLCIKHFESRSSGTGDPIFKRISETSLSTKGELEFSLVSSSLKRGGHSSKEKINSTEQRMPTRRTLLVCTLMLKLRGRVVHRNQSNFNGL